MLHARNKSTVEYTVNKLTWAVALQAVVETEGDVLDSVVAV